MDCKFCCKINFPRPDLNSTPFISSTKQFSFRTIDSLPFLVVTSLTSKHWLSTQNLLIMQNPDAEHRTCSAWQLHEKQNAQYKKSLDPVEKNDLNLIVSSAINKFPTTRSQFNLIYFLHKTILIYSVQLIRSLLFLSSPHWHQNNLNTKLADNAKPDAEHRTSCTASQYTQLHEKHNAQYQNKYINSHSAKQNWKN